MVLGAGGSTQGLVHILLCFSEEDGRGGSGRGEDKEAPKPH